MADNKLFIVDVSEPVWKSIARDTYSFGILAGFTWVANTQIEPSGWINMIIAIVWFIWMLGKASRHKIVKTPNEAREWLDEKYPR